MKIKLAFPDNPVFARLIKRKEEICREYDVEIYPVNEVQTSILMLQNRVDAAFLTPLGFGMGVTKIDYRIIPGMAFAAQGFTKLASVFFKKNLFTVEKCVSPHPDDFLTLIGKLLLAERYGIIVDLQKSSGSIEDMLVNADCVISRYLPGMEPAFDIGEEWSLTNDFPLPLGFWCVRAEEYPPKIIELINSLADSALPEEEVIEENTLLEIRSGKLIYRWNNDLAEGLNNILEFLFYLGFFPELPGVKILDINQIVK